MSAVPHVLFVTYNGLLEPLGLRQGLAYLEPLREDYRFSVLSFEKTTPGRDPVRWRSMADRLTRAGIEWSPLPYHRRPTVPATLYDVWAGVRAGVGIHAAARVDSAGGVDLVHARGYVPGMIARQVRSRTGARFLFDIRGLLADEYVDGGVWGAGSLPERLTRAAERRLLASADGIVTLTDAIRPEVTARLADVGREGEAIPWQVIPCCADRTEFRPDPAGRARVRAELGLGNELVLVYSGSVGTWYPVEPLVRLFAAVLERRPDARLLLVLNGEDRELRVVARSVGIPDLSIRTVHASPEEVPKYLAAADAGIALIQPSPSKRASSPTKVAEYLASGLPVVLNAGVGDNATLVGEGAVVVAASLDRPELRVAARELVERIGPVTARAAVDLAARRFDLREVGAKRYRALYRELLGAEPIGTTRHGDEPIGTEPPARPGRAAEGRD